MTVLIECSVGDLGHFVLLNRGRASLRPLFIHTLFYLDLIEIILIDSMLNIFVKIDQQKLLYGAF